LSLTLAPLCEGKGRDDLLWTDSAGQPLKPPASKDSWLSGAVARCQKSDKSFPRITAHDLRHTYASLAVSEGANVLVVQRQLSHRSAAMTLGVYSNLFDADLDAAPRRSMKGVAKMCPNGA
jgi:integrase